MTTLSLSRALNLFQPRRRRAALCRLDAPETVQLAHGELRRAVVRPGQGVQCLRGCLWITADGETVDHEVGAGDAFVPAGGAAIVIVALEDSRYRQGAATPGGELPTDWPEGAATRR